MRGRELRGTMRERLVLVVGLTWMLLWAVGSFAATQTVLAWIPCARVAAGWHTLATGVSSTFTAMNGSPDFSGVSASATIIVRDADGNPVVFVQSVRSGTVIMLGFDFYKYNADMARLLRNAVGASGPRSALLLQDAPPWESDVIPSVLEQFSISYERYTSADLGEIDLTRYCLLIVSSDQPQAFYDGLARHMARIETFVQNGGVVVLLAADDGWNDGSFVGRLPGGVIHNHATEDTNRVLLRSHPIVSGVPNPLKGNSAIHGYFSSLVSVTSVITEDAAGRPTTIEYRLGSGTVIASGVNVEWGVKRELSYSSMLRNIINYVWSLCSGGRAWIDDGQQTAMLQAALRP